MAPEELQPNVTGLIAQGGLDAVPLWVYVLIIGLAVLALVVPRRFARRSRILPRENVSEMDRLKKSMEELLIQLQEVSREVNATLDTKMIALNQLVEEAQARIDELKLLLDRMPGNPQTRSTDPAETQLGPRRELEETVLRLASRGKTELEIAQETGIPRGEIELILALRRKSSSAK